VGEIASWEAGELGVEGEELRVGVSGGSLREEGGS
jgi:hypothetical protein